MEQSLLASWYADSSGLEVAADRGLEVATGRGLELPPSGMEVIPAREKEGAPGAVEHVGINLRDLAHKGRSEAGMRRSSFSGRTFWIVFIICVVVVAAAVGGGVGGS